VQDQTNYLGLKRRPPSLRASLWWPAAQAEGSERTLGLLNLDDIVAAFSAEKDRCSAGDGLCSCLGRC
jgi:hypothetical protein